MRHTTTPTPNGRIELRVTDDDGRFLINVCQDEAHAERCIPVLERMLERDRLVSENEAAGWKRRMPLEPGGEVVGLRGKRMTFHP